MCVFVCACVRECVCVYKVERERMDAQRENNRDWPLKLEGPIDKAYMVPTANLWKMSVSLHLKLLWRRQGCIKASTSPSSSKILSLREKISFNYWACGFKFISVFQDFLQIDIQGAVVNIKMVFLIPTCFPSCTRQAVMKSQICCLYSKTCAALQRADTCNGSKCGWFRKEMKMRDKMQSSVTLNI